MEDTLRGADIIDTILRSMRENAEALRYSVVIPSAYDVYLHPDDFARFGELGGRIAVEAARALDEALEAANRRGSIVDNLRGAVGRPRLPWERVNRSWEIRLFEDPNGDMQPGDVFVEATLVVSEPGSQGGSETRRVRTARVGERTETREVVDARTATVTAPTVFATLGYRDDDGEAVFRMEKPSVLIGRGGPDNPVDLKLRTMPDVSRKHVRLRYDSADRRFYIKDMSLYGTSVNGEVVPPSLEDRDGQRVDRNIEAPLPDGAEIDLAGAVKIRFRSMVPR